MSLIPPKPNPAHSTHATHPSCLFTTRPGCCEPARKTTGSIGYDLSTPRDWPVDINSVDEWVGVGIDYGLGVWHSNLRAALRESDKVQQLVLAPGGRVRIDTGVSATMHACYCTLHMRSSARKQGLTLLGTAIIDQDYTGTFICWLWNLGPSPVTLHPGQAFAQIVIHHIPLITVEGHIPPEQERALGNAGGFGSTNLACRGFEAAAAAAFHEPDCDSFNGTGGKACTCAELRGMPIDLDTIYLKP
jgi:dUTPase